MTTYGYIRVSTQGQADSGLGLGAQRAELDAYARAHGLALRRVYADEGVSGARPFAERPEGRRLAERLRKGDAVVLRLDRGFRSMLDSVVTVTGWVELGVAVHLVDQRLDLTTPMGRAVLGILGAMAEMERLRIAERTRAALAERRRQGLPTNGTVPYGERLRGGRLVPYPPEQEAIAMAQRLRAEGETFGSVAHTLNTLGYAAPQGGAWTRQRVHGLLQRIEKNA